MWERTSYRNKLLLWVMPVLLLGLIALAAGAYWYNHKVVEEELGNQRKRKIREQNSYGLDQVRDGVSLGKDEVNDPIVDYEQIMRLPNLSFYVRLPGEYPVVRLKLRYRKQAKLHPGIIERNIRDALSPELEKVIQENERAAGSRTLDRLLAQAATAEAEPVEVA